MASLLVILSIIINNLRLQPQCNLLHPGNNVLVRAFHRNLIIRVIKITLSLILRVDPNGIPGLVFRVLWLNKPKLTIALAASPR